MIKQLKKWRQQRKLRQRLRKMEKALQLQLTTMQRVLVLDPKPPRELGSWPRQSGKTTCACLHMLLHAPLTAKYSSGEALQLLPDPDARNSVGTRVWTYKHLYRMSMKLHEAGIRTCVLLPPMPGVPAGFCGHGRHIDGRKGVVDDVGVYANRG